MSGGLPLSAMSMENHVMLRLHIVKGGRETGLATCYVAAELVK